MPPNTARTLSVLLAVAAASACPPKADGPQPACDDGVANGTETDVDCGGACERCATGARCAASRDCVQASCLRGVCRPPSCTDQVVNGDEADVDCGGGCLSCADGQSCRGPADCRSRVCGDGRCLETYCGDEVRDGLETDVDCGGSCAGCVDGRRCGAGADCRSKACDGGLCAAPSCSDRVANGAESDRDCGGGCPACEDGRACRNAADCKHGVCGAGRCLAPTCADGLKNADETDVDCGGACVPCGAGKKCSVATDCAPLPGASTFCAPGGVCELNACATGRANCNGLELDGCEASLASTASCGQCDNVCRLANAAPACLNKQCTLASCLSGYDDCDRRESTGCETSLRTPTDCGGCGRTCVVAHATPSCGGGACAVSACDPGWGDCDGAAATGCETNLQDAPAHCGRCGHACANGAGCVAGACSAVASCPLGTQDCDGDPATRCETDVRGSVLHCGACRVACVVAHGDAQCSGGACGIAACAVGFANCDNQVTSGCEVDLRSSPAHCGACGRSCGGGAGVACADGGCVYPSCAAVSAGAPSGVYTLGRPDAPWVGYCDLVGADGGWTLVLKADGSKSTFTYVASLWSNPDTLEPGSANLSPVEAKFEGFATLPVAQVRVDLAQDAGSRSLVFPVSATSLLAAVNAAPANTLLTSAGFGGWQALLTPQVLYGSCTREGFNLASGGGYSVRLGVLGNSAEGCDGFDSFLGLGGSGPISVGTHAFDGGDADSGVPAFGYVYVR